MKSRSSVQRFALATVILLLTLRQKRSLVRRVVNVLKTIDRLVFFMSSRSTMIDTHFLQRGPMGVKSPADVL
jgi:hypothetical protein